MYTVMARSSHRDATGQKSRPQPDRAKDPFGGILTEPLLNMDEGRVRGREIAERQLLYDIAEISSIIRSESIDAAITGGLATRAYAGPIRFTHDADFVVSKGHAGRMKGILKDLGYRGKRQNFGAGEILFAQRHMEDRRKGIAFTIELDISIGGIYDHSSGIHYPFTDRLMESCRTLPIRGFFPSSSSVTVSARVIGLEDLFILKTMTVATNSNGRKKDPLDALLLALKNPPDLLRVWEIARMSGISEHIRRSIETKLLPFLDAGTQPVMDKFGVSLDMTERDVIRSYLYALVSHAEPNSVFVQKKE